MTLLFIALVLIAVGWPVLALVTAVLVVLGLSALARGWARAEWRLVFGSLIAAVAAYGFGLSRTTMLSLADAGDRCSIAGFPGDWQPASQTLWPLRDIACGADLVPGFVNPLVIAAALVCAGLIGAMVLRRLLAVHRQ